MVLYVNSKCPDQCLIMAFAVCIYPKAFHLTRPFEEWAVLHFVLSFRVWPIRQIMYNKINNFIMKIPDMFAF